MSKSILDQEGWVTLLKKDYKPLPGRHWNPLEKSARSALFYNPTNHNSMRLTKGGYIYLKQHFSLLCYEFKLKEKITPKVLLQLERQIRYPYYVNSLTKIMVFDEQTAIMLQLHDSDLESYLNNLEQHQ